MSRRKKALLLALLLGCFLLTSCQSSITRTKVSERTEENVLPSSSELVLVWEGEEADGCHTVTLDEQGRAQFGSCSGPLSAGIILSDMERPEDLRHFLSTYRPFQADTLAGRINFLGHGIKTAEPSEQRAIAEWASIVYQELLYGRGGASWGAAITMNREGDNPCNLIQVEIYGKVMANKCDESISPYPRMWLTTEQLAQLYEWVDTFSTAELEFQGKDGQLMRFYLGGKGKQLATGVKLKEMLDWVQAVYEMAAR